MRRSTIFFLCLLATAACRGSDDDDGGDTDGANPDAPTSGDMRVQDVQNDATPIATPVTLRGVIVTAIDNYGPRKGNFYVAEPGGGEFSGVLVFGAPLEQVADLVVGDLVDITNAEKDEFSLETDDRTVTELVPVTGGEMTVTRVGTDTVPAPHVIDALVVGMMATQAREDEYEKWEGVLVTVNNVTVTSELGPVSSSNPDPTFVAFDITGVLEVDSSLAEIPYVADPPRFVNGGECLASVTGMGDYFFNYKVLPRATADIVKNGTGCPAAEAVGTCTDGVDNDANGFTDCMDRGCALEPTCTTDTTIVNIQNGTVTVDSRVNLNDVVVTAISLNRKNLWVADSAPAAPNSGIQVFRGNNMNVPVLPAEIVVGARVDVMGTVVEFNSGAGTGTLTQVARTPTVTFVPGAPAVPTPVTGVPLATLIDDTTGEPYESVLVELTNVRVIANPMAFGIRHFGMMGSANVLFESDDDIRAALAEADGTCYSLIRGIWSYQVFDDRWAILPLAGVADVVVATNQAACP